MERLTTTTHTTIDRPRYRPDIDGLRAIAVAAVVAYHAGIPGVTGGYVGVDIFFVISGFLITALLVDEIADVGRVNFVAFYARRGYREPQRRRVLGTAQDLDVPGPKRVRQQRVLAGPGFRT